MFQFTGYRLNALFNSHTDNRALPLLGFPIRKSPVDNGYLPLTEAYRSLSRPSSPTEAKAFTVRP